MANRVKYGLSNVYYAKATIASDGSATYDTPKRIPGAVNLSLDAKGENSPFYADNANYFESSSNQGYEGSLEVALIPEEFRAEILGETADANGVIIENANAVAIPFALMFQFEGDESGTRYVMYKCTCTRPQISGQTKEEGVEVQTETMNLTCSPIYNDGDYIVKGRCKNDTATKSIYDAWFSAVYVTA